MEALRAICCLGVITAHVWGYSHGWDPALVYGAFWRRMMMSVGQIGVPTFFAASGYLLYLPFARRDFGGGSGLSVRQYALNRARRIFPLYYVSVVIVLLFWNGGGSFEQWWRFLLFFQNFSVSTEGTVNGALWSLVVDLQFYALLPLLAFGIAYVTRRRIGLAAGVLLASVLASWFAYRYGATHFLASRRMWTHNFPACFCFIAAGMLLALLRIEIDKRELSLKGLLHRSDIWILAAVPVGLFTVYQYGYTYLNAVTAFLLLGAVVLPLRDGFLVRLLDWRPLAILGLATFSLYIWQGPVIRGLENDAWVPGGYFGLLVVALPIILVVGGLSYLVIERPFLSQRRTWSPNTAATSPRPAEELEAPAGAIATAPASAPAGSSPGG